jgi:hypothetical protein
MYLAVRKETGCYSQMHHIYGRKYRTSVLQMKADISTVMTREMY